MKIPFISNLKKPACASKQDVLELATLRYLHIGQKHPLQNFQMSSLVFCLIQELFQFYQQLFFSVFQHLPDKVPKLSKHPDLKYWKKHPDLYKITTGWGISLWTLRPQPRTSLYAKKLMFCLWFHNNMDVKHLFH